MNTNTLMTAQLKQQLLAQRADLLEQLTTLRGGPLDRAEASAEHFGHAEDSEAQVNSARDLEFALDEHETAELRLLDAALERIRAGTYGRCIDCGEPIALARLQAAPAAPRCVVCQQSSEQP